MSRLNVLFLTHRLPYAPNRGDRIRAYHMLRVLRHRCAVHMLSLVHDPEEASHIEEVRGVVDAVYVARVPRLRRYLTAIPHLAGRTPLTHVLLDSPDIPRLIAEAVAACHFDVVLAYGSGMARFAFEAPLDRLPLVIDMVDVDSVKWATLAGDRATLKHWVYRREAKYLSRFETAAATRAFATAVVNERERAALRAIAPHAAVEVVPIGVALQDLKPRTPPTPEPRVIFCGVMNYAPNEQGAEWLVRQVWPLVRQRVPRARLDLVGSHPTGRVSRLAADDPSVTVTGSVADVRPHLWRAAIAAAPLRVARGVQTKVLEAIAAGLPVVVTSAVVDGLPSEALPACLVADSPQQFAAAVVDCLLQTADQRRSRARKADLSRLTWENQLGALPDLLEAAAMAGRLRARWSPREAATVR
jgi:sugar transferase (PEP-CTERM/EpsH1 system associated)